MKVWVLLLTLVATGCATTQVQRPVPSFWQGNPTPLKEIAKRADELNWALLYMYAYVKTFNEYALLQGWKRPDAAPLCRGGELPDLPGLPKFIPKYDSADPASFERELVEYVKTVRRHYRDSEVMLKDFEESQRRTCLY